MSSWLPHGRLQWSRRDRGRGGSGCFRLAGAPVAAAGDAVLPVCLRVLHRPVGREPRAGHGAHLDRRSLGGCVASAMAGRRSHPAAAGDIGVADSRADCLCCIRGTARTCWRRIRSCGRRAGISNATFFVARTVVLFRSVARPAAVRWSAAPAGAAPRRLRRSDRVRAVDAARVDGLGDVAAAALALLEFGMMVATGWMLAAAALAVLHLTLSADGRCLLAATAGRSGQPAAHVRAGVVVPGVHAVSDDLGCRSACGNRLVHPTHAHDLAGAGVAGSRDEFRGALRGAADQASQAPARGGWLRSRHCCCSATLPMRCGWSSRASGPADSICAGRICWRRSAWVHCGCASTWDSIESQRLQGSPRESCSGERPWLSLTRARSLRNRQSDVSSGSGDRCRPVVVLAWSHPQRNAALDYAATHGAGRHAPRRYPRHRDCSRSPGGDLEALRSQKRALLSQWDWTDSSHRFARIPIERAMSLYAQGARADTPPQRAKEDKP